MDSNPKTIDFCVFIGTKVDLLTVSELPLPFLWLPCPLPEGALQLYPVKASPDRLNFDGFSAIPVSYFTNSLPLLICALYNSSH